MDETTIPLSTTGFATPLIPEQEEVIQLTEEDKAIAGLMSVPAWGYFERFVRARTEALRNSINTSKMTLEQIGQQYIVISKVCDEIEAILLNVKAKEQAVYENDQRERDESGK